VKFGYSNKEVLEKKRRENAAKWIEDENRLGGG
jgi:hypothetical protein